MTAPRTTHPAADAAERCREFLTRIGAEWRVHAVKAYRVPREALPAVPRIPCLDHEARLHGAIPPHVAAYVEDPDGGDLHEVIFTPDRHVVAVDTVSTDGEHGPESQARLLELLGRLCGDCSVAIEGPSLLRGDARVAAACRAQVSLRDVLTSGDLGDVEAAIDRLRTVCGLMEKESRVASWGIRTATPLLLAGAGVGVWVVADLLVPWIGEGWGNALRYTLLGLLGAMFLYFGLKAVHLTEMANRVWKRCQEYGLLLDERRRGASGPSGEG